MIVERSPLCYVIIATEFFVTRQNSKACIMAIYGTNRRREILWLKIAGKSRIGGFGFEGIEFEQFFQVYANLTDSRLDENRQSTGLNKLKMGNKISKIFRSRFLVKWSLAKN